MRANIRRPLGVSEITRLRLLKLYPGICIAPQYVAEELLRAVPGAAALIIRSATQVTAAVIDGLRTFSLDPERNPGRANVFVVQDRVVVVDYAHNEDGMRGLVEICRGLRPPGGRIFLTFASAGDRTNAIVTIHPGAGGLILFAGLYESWYPEEDRPEVTFTIVTCAANAAIAEGRSYVPPDYLFRIVRALRAVGMDFEARMIAAEAVARL